MWLKKFKIALVQEDVEGINFLLEDPPTLIKADEVDEAKTLIAEALIFVKKLQKSTEDTMIKINKNKNFLNATEAIIVNKLDIKS